MSLRQHDYANGCRPNSTLRTIVLWQEATRHRKPDLEVKQSFNLAADRRLCVPALGTAYRGQECQRNAFRDLLQGPLPGVCVCWLHGILGRALAGVQGLGLRRKRPDVPTRSRQVCTNDNVLRDVVAAAMAVLQTTLQHAADVWLRSAFRQLPGTLPTSAAQAAPQAEYR